MISDLSEMTPRHPIQNVSNMKIKGADPPCPTLHRFK